MQTLCKSRSTRATCYNLYWLLLLVGMLLANFFVVALLGVPNGAKPVSITGSRRNPAGPDGTCQNQPWERRANPPGGAGRTPQTVFSAFAHAWIIWMYAWYKCMKICAHKPGVMPARSHASQELRAELSWWQYSVLIEKEWMVFTLSHAPGGNPFAF